MEPFDFSQLEGMTLGEKIKKFLPLKNSGKISVEIFDQIVGYHAPEEAAPEAPETLPVPVVQFGPPPKTMTETLLEAFPGSHEVEIDDQPLHEKQSQKARLLKLLSDFCWHDTPNIMAVVYGVGHSGVCRISERIRELKEMGYQIESRKKSQTVQEYRLTD